MLIFQLLLCFFFLKNSDSDKFIDLSTEIEKLTIISTSFSIRTEVSINCDQLENALPTKRFIYDKRECIDSIINLIDRTEITYSPEESNVDTRAKVIVEYRYKSKDSFCMDRIGRIYYNQKVWSLPIMNPFVDFVERLYYFGK